MSIEVTVTKTVDSLQEIVSAFRKIAFSNVLIGIPQSESSRNSSLEPNNAELAYIHTHGSPKNNIPPRPFLQPSIEKNRDFIAQLQANIVKDALAGRATAVTVGLNRLGLFASSKAKEYITKGNNLVPNALATIARKGSDRPLIDTGQLVNAITYVVDVGRGL